MIFAVEIFAFFSIEVKMSVICLGDILKELLALERLACRMN